MWSFETLPVEISNKIINAIEDYNVLLSFALTCKTGARLVRMERQSIILGRNPYGIFARNDYDDSKDYYVDGSSYQLEVTPAYLKKIHFPRLHELTIEGDFDVTSIMTTTRTTRSSTRITGITNTVTTVTDVISQLSESFPFLRRLVLRGPFTQQDAIAILHECITDNNLMTRLQHLNI